MENLKINSAGILYFYLRGDRLDNEKINIEVVDTYKYLLDSFYKKTKECAEECIDPDNRIHIFGVIGINDKVDRISEAISNCIKENFERLLQRKTIRKRCSELDALGNIFNQAVQEFFVGETLIYPKRQHLRMEDMSLFYIYGADPKDFEKETLANATIETWLNKEVPGLLGKQVMIRSFYMQNFVGRKLLSSVPFGFSDSWNLLFEGGRSLALDSEYIYNETIPNVTDIGFFTVSGVESILLNPIYAFGIWYTPNDICIEWHKVFLYVCALIRKEWSICSIKKIYASFLDFLGNNICMMQEAPPMISEEKYYLTLLQTIKNFQSFLKGEDEPVTSKELLQVLNSRYVYLPHILDMFSKEEPAAHAFSKEEMALRIGQAMQETDTYQKGVLWEDAVEYYLNNIDGFKITAKRIRAGHQEIDISIINTSVSDILWQMGAYILVECKNYIDHVGIKEIRNIAYICNMKGCKTALLFAANGITDDAKREITRLSGIDIYVVCITKHDLVKLKSNHDCVNLLVSKFLNTKIQSENQIPI